MKVPPCKDCKDRALGCHTTCTKYIDWKASHDVEMEALREYVMLESSVEESKARSVKRNYNRNIRRNK